MARAAIAALLALAGAAAIVVAASDDGRDQAPSERPGAGWGSLAPSPLQRTEVGAARLGDRIYVVGGFISSGGTTGRTVAYDISEDEWKEVAPLPIAVNHPGVAAHRGRLYLLGGNLPPRAGEQAMSRRLYRYAPKRDRWRRLPDAPTARGALAIVGIGYRLYAVGGSSPTDDTLRTLEIFDLKRGRWSEGAKMPTGRNHVGATYLKRDVVVTGGRPGPVHGGLATVERYDPANNRWHRMAPLGTARSGHATAAVGGRLGGRIVVFGGEELDGGTTIEQVEVFDPRVRAWRPLPEMVTPRHGVGGAAEGRRVYALEGGPQPGLSFSGALEYLDLP